MHEHYVIPVLSNLWWTGLIGSVLVIIFLIKLGLNFRLKLKENKYRSILFYFFLIREIVYYSFIIATGKFTFVDSLPLQLCNISYFIVILYFYNPKALLFEYLLMLGFPTAFYSLITPELTHGLSNYFLIDYYVSHGAIVFAPLYGVFVLNEIPRIHSWKTIFVASNILLFFVGIINYFLNSNYIYICTPPKANNIFITGGFPYHLIGFDVFGILHILLIYWFFRTYFVKFQKQL
ncbi:MAG: TIGR02206 family membrane protein [Saprospiraceae bacterium]|nr:TIGR02206 family membrane protein [Saprospiraceae bacterium]